MKIRLIALDMDGTALNSSRQVTNRLMNTLKKAMDSGILIVPATGRTYLTVPEEIMTLTGIRYVIASNGADVVDSQTEERLYQAMLPYEEALAVAKRLSKYPVYRYIHSQGIHYDTKAMNEQLNIHEPGILALSGRKTIDNLEDFLSTHRNEIEKVGAICFDDKSYQTILAEEKQFGHVNMASTGHFSVEFNSPMASKGIALAFLCKQLGISLAEVMVLGDNQNDISMFQKAGYSVAMGNAIAEIKQIATEVTLSCDEDGAAIAIEKVLTTIPAL